jgi:hypothetical protein
MNNISKFIISLIVITLLFGTFGVVSIIRLRKLSFVLKSPDEISKSNKAKYIFGVICESILLLGAVFIYIILLLGIVIPR